MHMMTVRAQPEPETHVPVATASLLPRQVQEGTHTCRSVRWLQVPSAALQPPSVLTTVLPSQVTVPITRDPQFCRRSSISRQVPAQTLRRTTSVSPTQAKVLRPPLGH